MNSPNVPHDRSQPDSRQLRPGVKLVGCSLVVAAISLLLFCYALDWKFTAPQRGDAQPVVKRIPMGLAMTGFGASILVFWMGYMNLSRR